MLKIKFSSIVSYSNYEDLGFGTEISESWTKDLVFSLLTIT